MSVEEQVDVPGTGWASDPDQFVEYQVIHIADQLRRRFEEALRPHGLSPRQFSVLAVLRSRPGVTSADLARAVLTTPQSMGPLVEQLEATGLVEPRERRGRGVPAPNRLSPTGSQVLDDATNTVRALDRSTREALGSDLGPLLAGLNRLAAHLTSDRSHSDD